MRNRVWTLVSISTALVCLTACNDNDGSGTGVGSPDFSNAAVSQVMGSNVLPAIQSIAFSMGFFDSVAAVSSGGSSPLGVPICSTEGCTSGGSVMTCETATGAEFTFASCIETDAGSSFTIDGTLGGECSQTVTDITCSLEVDLQVAFSSAEASFDFELFGGLSETFDMKSLCSSITRSDYGMTVLGDSTTLSGSLEICSGELYPAGHKSITVISQLHGAYRFEMYFDGTSVVSTTVLDHTDGSLLGTCNVDFDTGDSVCHAV